ncbi:hypothetical protein LTR56_004156 [Elasticomyces elasticus]|nr:hypothetical protein LTR22_015361 [Elasticomyces elasticus]KAK3654102.1 hypothetical protein LTR56_004156 [Elasticomyces elasticus]KAK4914680.1 hypothetical protein LTR49_017122 [Elasticomyces elasticus]KAK5753007.1 hypothetical protein LTS12_016883 [Elasticomyces elasticus]
MSDRRRRPLYAPPPPPSRNHSVLGFWVPVVVTTTLALGGLAAWVWSERSEHDDDEGYPPPIRQDVKPQPYPPPQQGGGLPNYSGPLPSQSAGAQGQPAPAPAGGEAASYYGNSRSGQQHEGYGEDAGEEQTFFGQVRGAMRRTPSPQQFYDQASKQVSAGLAAAGGVLGSIMEDGDEVEQEAYGRRGGEERRGGGGEVREERREEQREGFSDHERWSEEAEEKERDRGVVEVESERRADAARSGRSTGGEGKQRARKTVAVVVSADTNMDGKMDEEDIIYDQHASILSHLPEHHNPSLTDLFILIYAPGLLTLPPITYRPTTPHLDITDTGSNLGSSYSQVNTSTNTPQAVTPSEELQSISPKIDAEPDFKSPGQQFDALYTQALSLVDHPSKILCFTTASGYTSLLRHLAPQLAYVSDLLAGEEGRVIAKLRGWVGSAVLVVGDDGTGGLAADSDETEDDGMGAGGRVKGRREEQWYERSGLVGLGKGLEVVDVARVGDDWGKRVGGRE